MDYATLAFHLAKLSEDASAANSPFTSLLTQAIDAVKTLKKVQDALNTEETGDNLVSVARAAHTAELTLAFEKH